MQRYITDISNLTLQDIQNTDWDIIQLPFNVDYLGLLDWYRHIKNDLSSAKFVISKEYEKYYDSNMLRRWQAADPSFDSGNPTYWWLLNWSKERYDPLPFSFIANKELYPEIVILILAINLIRFYQNINLVHLKSYITRQQNIY